MAKQREAPHATSNESDRMTEPLPPYRQGPRPLALHVWTAVLTWTGSCAALPFWRHASLLSNPKMQARAQALNESLLKADPGALDRAVRKEVESRLRALQAGIDAYRLHPYRRTVPAPKVVWQEGSTRLLDFARPDQKTTTPILVVPSLINRAYILDLREGQSLMRWLATQGYRPLLVDWDAPGPAERKFTLTDYVAGRLEAALDHILDDTGRPPHLMGYCMGGLLALGLAARRQKDLATLALLATPWDFHAENAEHARMASAAMVPLAPLVEALGELPLDMIQTLFATLDPQLVARKFLAFSHMDTESSRAEAFVSLEDWLNDGVPLAAPVARECLGGWYGENSTQRRQWRVAGQVVDPARVTLPSLCVIPERDRIVPPGSARALAEALPNGTVFTPHTGHIGMVASGRAEKTVWRPLGDWLKHPTAG